jgi:hypothetical protein
MHALHAVRASAFVRQEDEEAGKGDTWVLQRDNAHPSLMAGLHTLGSSESYYLLRTQDYHDTSKIYRPKFHEPGLSDDTQYLYCGREDNTE